MIAFIDNGNAVTFEHGRKAPAAHVISCFGYMSDVTSLPDDPSVSFFGLARPTILSLSYMFKVRCMYAQKVWSNALPLPERDVRWSKVEAGSAVSLFDWISRRRIARHGRAVGLRNTPPGDAAR